ncbi:MarR family winged helix-turn-helix transcriptional regulator [Arthrobacter sp. NEB 688]|uniref:MarR family winged helix-turn-helix transcriptional regulator n=1 Tax=Arthrobacter sp. NEB 688 TaxID=904039 RepID=UPI0015673747|nr:MarR family winged helix-turn-helix transcriptional regulator [Arthrobacter sp. NEB 688]QKE84344.1 winged helix-turn-helix transcriptional regulator [Arthrobacter sp. NEB 688]
MDEPPATHGDAAPRRLSWTSRRGIPPEDAAEHSPWLRLHEHLAVRHGVRADGPRRWERPDADDPLHLPALLRQAGRQLDRDLARLLDELAPGLTPDGLDVLRRVAVKPSDGVNVAEYLGRSESSAGRILGVLAARGLVVREPGWRDFRTRRTLVTDEGRDLLARVEEPVARLLGDALLGLEDDECHHLRVLLRELADRPVKRPTRARRRTPRTPPAAGAAPATDAAGAA